LFARVLRASGFVVRASGVPDAVLALADVGVRDKATVRSVLRAVLVCRREDFIRFDPMFERFWRAWREGPEGLAPRPMELPRKARSTLQMLAPAPAPGGGDEAAPESHALEVARHTYSATELWRRKDFASYTPDESARARQALARLAWTPGVRPTRRWEAGGRRTVDLRRLVRTAGRPGGELVTVPYRVRRMAPRPLIFMCDVSGSMEPYTRMLLLFAHALARREGRLEAFVFSTRLTRVTRQVTQARADDLMARLGDAVRDWSGGTRIGEAIRTFNTEWARRVRRHGPMVLLVSDGWDLGDPRLLARELARLQRTAYRLVWLNPLLGSPGYEPLTRGMQAALPFVDDFLPAHNLVSLESLAASLETLAAHRPARRPGQAP
jgi:hypothetical protein